MGTNGENQTAYLARLRASGGSRISLDLTAETVKQIEKIRKRDKLASKKDVIAAAVRALAEGRK